MADFGLKVIGESGQFQIYKNELNFGLLQKGTTLVAAGHQKSSHFTIVNLGRRVSNSAMLFMRPRNFNVPVMGFIMLDGNLNYLYFTTGEASIYVDWYIFDIVQNIPATSDKYGLRVWDENGNLAFTSGSKMLKIVGVGKAADIGNYPTALPPLNVPIATGGTLAAYASNYREFIDGDGPPEGGGPYSNFHYDGIYVNSTNVGVSEFTAGTIMSESQVATKSGGVIIAADVTGL